MSGLIEALLLAALHEYLTPDDDEEKEREEDENGVFIAEGS